MPGLRATQKPGIGIQMPEHRQVAIERFRDRLRDLPDGIGPGRRRQDACHGMLSRRAPFGLLALRQVTQNAADEYVLLLPPHRERTFHREFRPVLSPTAKFECGPGGSQLPCFKRSEEPLTMPLMEPLRHQPG